MTTYTKGQRVRFTVDSLGATRTPYATRTVADYTVNAGDPGSYLEPFEGAPDLTDWHIVIVHPKYPTPSSRNPQETFYVPVHDSMIEPAE